MYNFIIQNPDWIRTGAGGMIARLVSGDGEKDPAPLGIVAHRPIQECTTDELFAELVRRALHSIGRHG
jgi:hypothetical protein